MRSDYLIRPPRHNVLRSLLAFGATRCDQFLVTLTGMKLASKAETFLSAAEPFLDDRRQASEYPGGRLPWGTIEVRTYRLVPPTLELIAAAARSLFDWQEPDLPNDLCLLRSGDPWLITMASDKVAVLVLDPVELAEVVRDLPSLEPHATAGDPQ